MESVLNKFKETLIFLGYLILADSAAFIFNGGSIIGNPSIHGAIFPAVFVYILYTFRSLKKEQYNLNNQSIALSKSIHDEDNIKNSLGSLWQIKSSEHKISATLNLIFLFLILISSVYIFLFDSTIELKNLKSETEIVTQEIISISLLSKNIGLLLIFVIFTKIVSDNYRFNKKLELLYFSKSTIVRTIDYDCLTNEQISSLLSDIYIEFESDSILNISKMFSKWKDKT